VRPHTTVGRVPLVSTDVRTHTAPLTAVELSHLEPRKLATASDDGTIKVHVLPDTAAFAAAGGELPANVTSAEWTFQTNGARATLLKFHPYITGALVSAMYNGGAGVDEIGLYRITDGTEGGSDAELATVYAGLTEQRVMDIDFCADGATIALTSKDNLVTFVSLPSGRILGRFAPPQKTKELLVRFVDTEHVVTVGFERGTERSASLINIDKALSGATDAVIATVAIPNIATPVAHFDAATGLLFVTGVGSCSYTVLSITPGAAPYVDLLSNFTSRSDVVASAALPKRDVDVREVEVLRTMKLSKTNEIWPVSWRVPRKRKELFQDDIYHAGAHAAASQAPPADWFAGVVEREVQANGRGQAKYPVPTISLQPAGMDTLSAAPQEELSAGQKRYLAQQLAKSAEPARGFLGHTSGEEAMDYFRKRAEELPANSGRFDARTSDKSADAVADDEWDD